MLLTSRLDRLNPDRLERLTPAQDQQLLVLRDKWLRIGLSTQPAERRWAEAGVQMAYRAANLEPPTHVLWCDSPLAGALAASWLAQGSGRSARRGSLPQIKEQVRAQLLAQLPERVRHAVGAPVKDRVNDLVRDRIVNGVGDLVEFQCNIQVRVHVYDVLDRRLWALVGDQIRAQLSSQLRYEVAARAQLGRCAYGQYDASWVAFCYAFRMFGLIAATEGLGGIRTITENCGWWWPLEGLCVLTERPTRLECDEEGRLHSASGPALAYPDGWSIYAWHGVRVPEVAILRPESITVRQIQHETNIELRRVLLERYGFDRYVVNGGAQPIHSDTFGTLYRCELPGEEPRFMVSVTNSTAEADGTFRLYVLRVPPGITTAREAVAWTFGIAGQDYRPEVET
jgi:hypothetical protein